MPNNYDNSAWFYDSLSRLIFGNAIVNAQVYLLQYIPPAAKLIIIGGGTGWILEQIARVHPSGINITYVELSAKMIVLAQKKSAGLNQVTFINKAVEETDLADNFDVVITPFLFDSFSEHTLDKVFNHLHGCLKPGGFWLYADFRSQGNWWQRALLKTMLVFFKLLCNIEAESLPDVNKQFSQYNYSAVAQKTFFGDFILARILRRK